MIERPHVFHQEARLAVEQIGSRPTVGFVAGAHGDEGAIIPLVESVLDTKPVGDHVRILRANPKALEAGTRKADGKDLNRQFPDGVPFTDLQAKLVAESLREYTNMHTVFSFHEDLEEEGLYAYYTPKNGEIDAPAGWASAMLKNALSDIANAGFVLYNGIDDPDLKNEIRDGFMEAPADGPFDHTLESWLPRGDNHPSVTRTFTFEIPGKITPARKYELVGMIFDRFVHPFVARVSSQNGS